MTGRRRAPAVLWIAALVLATPPSIGAQEGTDAGTEPVPAAEKRVRHFDVKASLETRYDDNILKLSEKDKDLFEMNPDSERFSIETIDDYVAIGRIDLRWSGKPIRKRETAIRASLDAFRYARNGIKDYERFGVSIFQEITASRRHLGSLRIAFSRTPSFYKRQRVDEDASFDAGRVIIREYSYAESKYSLAYKQEIVNRRFEARLGREYSVRDYNHHFNERDSTKDTWSVALYGRPFGGSPIEIGLDYQTGDLRARGDLPSSRIADDDVSYRHRAVILEVEIRWKAQRRGRINISAERQIRNFTTDNRFDIGHSGREDERRDYRADLVQRLTRSLTLVAELQRKSNDVVLLSEFAKPDDVTDFVENRVTVGLAWNVDF